MKKLTREEGEALRQQVAAKWLSLAASRAFKKQEPALFVERYADEMLRELDAASKTRTRKVKHESQR